MLLCSSTIFEILWKTIWNILLFFYFIWNNHIVNWIVDFLLIPVGEKYHKKISCLLFYSIWKNYIPNWDFLSESWMVDFFASFSLFGKFRAKNSFVHLIIFSSSIHSLYYNFFLILTYLILLWFFNYEINIMYHYKK